MSKKIKKPLTQRLCEALDVPVCTFGTTSLIEAVGNREISISGCLGLVSYTEELVVLELCDGVLTVAGSLLELHSFSCGRVSVSGIISRISYGEGETVCHDC